MKIISFYTINSPYEDEIKNLERSCLKFGYDLIKIKRQTQGNWEVNCAMKPGAIIEAMEQVADDEICMYLDADAVIVAPIKYALHNSFGVHLLKGKVLSGTIMMRKNKQCMDILEEWDAKAFLDPYIWDQETLQEVLKNHTFDNLPRTLCKIFDHAEEPLAMVVHNQASRRFKKFMENKVEIPKKIGKSRIVINADGSVNILRHDLEAEKWLNAHMIKMGNELRWRPRVDALNLSNLDLGGEHAYVIGKGPSLDKLKPKHFTNPDSPVICINESVHKIEELGLPNPIYSVVQDAWLRGTCVPKKYDTTAIVSINIKNYYEGVNKIFTFTNHQILPKGTMNITVNIAICILKNKGFKSVTFMAFDAAMNGELEYAKSIGYSATNKGPLERFKGHRKNMEKAAKGLVIDFFNVNHVK